MGEASPSRIRPTAAIVAVGNEILFGETVDTNSAWLARTLTGWGVRVVGGYTVRDRDDEIRTALTRAMASADVVIVSGGLGPTDDDVTKAAVAGHLGVGLVVDETVRRAVEERFRASGRPEMPARSAGQAEILEGSVALPNERGTAPGILVERDGTTLVLLPGVPAELRGIVSGPLRAAWEERGLVGERVRHLVIHTTGVPESRLAELVDEPWRRLAPDLGGSVGFAFLPDELGVDLRLSVGERGAEEADALLARVERVLAPVVEPWRFRAESGDLAEAVTEELLRAGLTLAAAESCTGGLVAQRMTDRAGASEVFLGGVVAYHNDVKIAELGVSPDDLERHGAVSEEVARAMASGVVERLGADVGVSITGVAGPGGGSAEKPVGTVWIAVALEGKLRADRTRFAGDRGAVRRRAAQAALAMLHRGLRDRRAGT